MIPSGKTASNRFDIADIDPDKTLTRAEMRWLATALQYIFRATEGISYGPDEGSIEGINNFSLISSTNYNSYKEKILQTIQTLIANKNLLIVDPSSTANALILNTRYIDNQTTFFGINDSVETSLPFRFRDGLELDFVALANNTGAVTISILNFLGANGALNVVKQNLSALTANSIKVGYRYTIICDHTNNRFILKDDGSSNSVINGTGWAKYSNGIITNQLQTPTINSGGSTTITLPTAYTSSTSYRCFATLLGGIPNQSYTPSINKISNTQVTIGHFATGGSAAIYDIFAIGI